MAYEYRDYRSDELPRELVDVPSGEVRYYQGVPYKVINNQRGGRILERPSFSETGVNSTDRLRSPEGQLELAQKILKYIQSCRLSEFIEVDIERMAEIFWDKVNINPKFVKELFINSDPRIVDDFIKWERNLNDVVIKNEIRFKEEEKIEEHKKI